MAGVVLDSEWSDECCYNNNMLGILFLCEIRISENTSILNYEGGF